MSERTHDRLEDISARNEDLNEGALAFVMRAERSGSAVGVDRARPDVLEIAAIWGDTVLDVRHLPLDTPVVTLGSAMRHRLHLLGRPMAWVPSWVRRVDWVFGPGIAETRLEREHTLYAPDAELPEPGFALLERSGDGFTLRIREGWGGFVEIEGGRWALEELIQGGHARSVGAGVWALELSPGRRAAVEVGPLTFFVHLVPPSDRVVAPVMDRVDPPFLGTLSFTAFLGLMMGVLVSAHPGYADNEVVEIPDRFAEVFIQQPEVEKQKPTPTPAPPQASAARAPGEEGRAGERDATRREARGDQARMNQIRRDREIAENAGFLGALRDGGGLDGVFGSSGLAGIAGDLGGLSGPLGARIGNGGLGDRGPGLGGGGEIGSLGGGMGTCSDSPERCGDAALGGLTAGGEKAIGSISSDEPPILLGSLDRAHVDAVIKRHMNQIRYCYQRELQKTPTLGGKISVRFVIAGDGTVSAARIHKSSLNSAAAESCVTNRFFHFRFDAPKNNGTVIVTYPFLFSPG